MTASDDATPVELLAKLAKGRRASARMVVEEETSAAPSAAPRSPHEMLDYWGWQTCNEFGFFQSAGSEESPFHPLNSTLSVDYYLQQCKDAYKLPHPFTAVPTDFTNVRDIPYPRPSAWRSDGLSGARSRTTGRARWAPRAWSCRTARWTRGTRSRWSSP